MVARKGLAAIAPVHGAIEEPMGDVQKLWHEKGIVEVVEGLAFELGTSIKHALGSGLDCSLLLFG
jgi:hypothetical protein